MAAFRREGRSKEDKRADQAVQKAALKVKDSFPKSEAKHAAVFGALLRDSSFRASAAHAGIKCADDAEAKHLLALSMGDQMETQDSQRRGSREAAAAERQSSGAASSSSSSGSRKRPAGHGGGRLTRDEDDAKSALWASWAGSATNRVTDSVMARVLRRSLKEVKVWRTKGKKRRVSIEAARRR